MVKFTGEEIATYINETKAKLNVLRDHIKGVPEDRPDYKQMEQEISFMERHLENLSKSYYILSGSINWVELRDAEHKLKRISAILNEGEEDDE